MRDLSAPKASHLAYMQRALLLAARGKGHVNPNPLVGCVIVRQGKIVGEGTHEVFGGPHAEVNALKKAWGHAKGATLYINLEPCTHWGKTPPCIPILIQAGIKEVHIATLDPNPLVAGKGVAALRRAGIKVRVGLEKVAAARLNRPFLTWMKKKRPYVILKMAMSLDGKIATHKGDSRWISSPASRRLVHKLRAESDAVLVGANTAVRDNPYLTAHGAGRDPLRIVLDPHLRTRPNLRVYGEEGRTMIITASSSNPEKIKILESKGVQILRTPLNKGRIKLKEVLRLIAKYDVSQLLVEGGGNTAWSFVREGLVDEILFFVAPIMIGGVNAITSVEGEGFARIKNSFRLNLVSVGRIGNDILIKGETA